MSKSTTIKSISNAVARGTKPEIIIDSIEYVMSVGGRQRYLTFKTTNNDTYHIGTRLNLGPGSYFTLGQSNTVITNADSAKPVTRNIAVRDIPTLLKTGKTVRANAKDIRVLAEGTPMRADNYNIDFLLGPLVKAALSVRTL